MIYSGDQLKAEIAKLGLLSETDYHAVSARKASELGLDIDLLDPLYNDARKKHLEEMGAKAKDDTAFFGYASVEAVRETLTKLEAAIHADITAAYSDQYVDVAAALEHFEKAEFARLGNRLKQKGLNLSRWESTVHARMRMEHDRLKELKLGAKQTVKVTATQPQAIPKWIPAEKIAGAPVDGRQLLSDLVEAIRKFVVLDEPTAQTVALWILFTWVFDKGVDTNPFLRILSPAPECGKSTLLKVLKRLTRSGWLVSRVTQSAFVRTMSDNRRTLIIDEGDAFLNENEAFRNVLDGASDPDTANVSMSITSGEGGWTPAEFNVYVPIVIASINMLRRMQTVESRSLHVHLRRAKPHELSRIAKGRRYELNTALTPLAERCARWAADSTIKFEGNHPQFSDKMSGRDMDKWEPLVIIADAISPAAGIAARLAASGATASKAAGTEILGIMLLGDIRQIFDGADEKLSSKTLCARLEQFEGRPWPEYGKSRRPISQNQVAGLLSGFGVGPHKIRIGTLTPNGYEAKDFIDAWDRYLRPLAQPLSWFSTLKNISPTSGDDDLDRNSGTTAGRVTENGFFEDGTEPPCSTSENGSFPYAEKQCSTVPVEQGVPEGKEEKNTPFDAALDDAQETREAARKTQEKEEIDRLAKADEGVEAAADKKRF